MPLLDRGHFLPGGTLLGTDGGVNETYRGIIEVPPGRVPAYVKLLNVQQLCNELLAFELARRARFKIPEAYLVRVAISDYPTSKVILSAGTDVIGFASADIGISSARKIGVTSPSAWAALLSAWKEWPDVAAFDDWIANIDRNSGNFLVGAPGDVWLIDHGHAFTGPTWCSADLVPSRVCHNLLCEVARGGVSLPERFSAFSCAVGMQSAFGALDPASVVSTSGVSGYLSPGDISAVQKFLEDRVSSIHERVASLLGIPVLGAGVTP